MKNVACFWQGQQNQPRNFCQLDQVSWLGSIWFDLVRLGSVGCISLSHLNDDFNGERKTILLYKISPSAGCNKLKLSDRGKTIQSFMTSMSLFSFKNGTSEMGVTLLSRDENTHSASCERLYILPSTLFVLNSRDISRAENESWFNSVNLVYSANKARITTITAAATTSTTGATFQQPLWFNSNLNWLLYAEFQFQFKPHSDS